MDIPIVYNTSAPSENTLAGGNFFYVETLGDEYGHNVWGISGVDSNITVAEAAPGKGTLPLAGVCDGCHFSLALDPADNMFKKNGCQGCHYYDKQHHMDPALSGYRYLRSHMGILPGLMV